MATAGVSRSGRVRKRSSKLIDMETEPTVSPQNNTNNEMNKNRNTKKLSPNVTQNNVSFVDNTPIEDSISKSSIR